MHLLSPRDRAGAKAVAAAWKLEGNPKLQYDVRWQSNRRDPMCHAKFFKEVVLRLSDKERDKLNRDAISEQIRRTCVAEFVELCHVEIQNQI